MKDLLSADDLNSLLTAVSEGGGPSGPEAAPPSPARGGEEIRPYDFRQGDRLGRDQARALRRVHDEVAIALSGALSGALSTPVQASLVGVELTTYGVFNAALPDPVCLESFRTRPGDFRGLVAMETPLAFDLVERVLGGQGEAPPEQRPLTAIEQAILAPQLHTILGKLADGWSAREPVAFEPEKMAMNPKAVQILALQELVLHITLNVVAEGCVGDINVCLPFQAVDRFIPRALPAGPGASGDGEASSQAREAIRRALGAAPVRVAVELGRAQISILELLRLQPGHVVRLDSRVGRPLDVAIEDARYLAGHPGLVGNRLSIQVARTPATPKEGS